MKMTVEVSVWAKDLKAGHLPPVCAKSGKHALGTIRMQFYNSPGDAWRVLVPGAGRGVAVKGGLPFSPLYSLAITTARVLLVAAFVGVIYAVWNMNVNADVAAITWIVLLGSVGYSVLFQAVLRPALEPTGTVIQDPSGAVWVRLRGVHPNFVAAIEAARAPAAVQAEAEPQRT